MKSKIKRFLAILSLSLLFAGVTCNSAHAFFIGRDAYTVEEYKKANIVWEHNKILLDKYYFNGKSISQEMAERLTTLYFNNFDTVISMVSEGKQVDEKQIRDLYLASANVTIDSLKDSNKEIEDLKSRCIILELRNAELNRRIAEARNRN